MSTVIYQFTRRSMCSGHPRIPVHHGFLGTFVWLLCSFVVLLALPTPVRGSSRSVADTVTVTCTDSCPTPCLCVVLQDSQTTSCRVDCSYSNLTTVPGQFPLRTSELLLNDNNITGLTNSTFSSLTYITTLDLANNPQILQLPIQIFEKLLDLEDLNLSGIGLTSISESIFNNLRFLKELTLTKNAIPTLPRLLLHNQGDLEYLDVSNLGLTELNEIFLASCTALKEFYATSNVLQTIPDNFFEHCKRMLILDLSINGISNLPARIFGKQKKLTHLNLSGNSLTTLSTNISLTPTLTSLNIASNPWRCDCDLLLFRDFILNNTALTVEDGRLTICDSPPHQEGIPLQIAQRQKFISHSVASSKHVVKRSSHLSRETQRNWADFCQFQLHATANLKYCNGSESFMSCALDATSPNETREAVLYFTSYSTTDPNLCQEHCLNSLSKYAVLNSDICLCGNTHPDFDCPCRFQPEPSDGYYDASLCNKFYLRGSFTVLANLTFDYVPPMYMGTNYTFQAHTIAAIVGQYMWNFGDSPENYYSDGPSIAYSYVLPGMYVLNLQVNTVSQSLSGRIPVKVLNLVTGYKMKCSKHIDYSNQMAASLSISQGTEVELPWKRVDKYGEELQVGSCLADWQQHRGRCVRMINDSLVNITDAEVACSNLGGTILTIDHHAEISELITSLGSMGSYRYLLGMRRSSSGQYWLINANTLTIFTDEDVDTTSGGECVVLTASGLMSCDCSETESYICDTKPSECPLGGAVFNGHCYVYQNEAKDYLASQQDCMTLTSGNLAAIQDADINAFITTNVVNLSVVNTIWIGLNDQMHENYFVWPNSEPVGNYRPWGMLEPNNNPASQDCVVMITGGTEVIWEDQDCSQKQPYICEYFLHDKVSTTPFVLGTAIFKGDGSLQPLSHSILPNNTEDTKEYIFPGLHFSETGKLTSFNFKTVSLTKQVTMVLQVLKPSCTSPMFLEKPGCSSPYYHVPRCTNVKQSCQTYPTCDAGTKFCLTNNSCINNYESCSCAGVPGCQTSYSPTNLDAIPTFTVVREYPVVIPAGSETAYEVSGSNLDVKLGYILGMQVKPNSLPLLCNATDDDWSQPVLWRNTTGWFPRRAPINSSDPWVLDSATTCYIRAIYMRKVIADIPAILTYSREPETYEVEVHLHTSLDNFRKQCTLTAEQPITNLSWIYPGLIASVSSAGAILDMEYNESTSLVVRVSQGSHMQATWNSSMLSIITDYFGESCPNSVFNLSTCDLASVPSLTPFSSIAVQLLETTICQPILVTVKNNISDSDIIVRIEHLLEIRGLQMVPLLDLVEIGIPYNISTLVICGEDISYQWRLNDSIVGNDSTISLTFPTPSIYKILVNASNFLGFETADSSVIAKIRANLYLLQFNISEIICLINVQQIIEITVLGVGSGAEVTITSNLGNNKQLIQTYVMNSTQLQQAVALNYSSVGTYTVNVTATDGFDTLRGTRSAQVVNEMSPIILQANATLFSTVDSALFNVTLTGKNEGDIVYYWNIDGSNITSVESILHTFPVHGNYVVSVIASNGVSSVTAKIDVVVQEIISDVIVTAVPSGILALSRGSTVSVNISGTVIQGSHSVFSWSERPVIVDDGWAQYTYHQAGTTSIKINVSNDVSELVLTHLIEVQEIIRGVKLSCSDCVGDYLASSTNTVLSAFVEEGSNAVYVYNMDGQSPVYGPNIPYMVPTRGSYQIVVNASNSISSDNVTLVINVEDAITGLSISSDRLVTALNSTVTFSIAMATGSDLQYDWSFCQSCLEATVSKTAEYMFETEGEHVVSSRVWNHVSSESTNQTMLVLTPLTFVKITSNLIGNEIAEVGSLYRLTAITDSNFQTNYSWSFGLNNGIKTKFSIQEIVYNFTAFGSYHLLLEARNQISNISNDISLAAEERIVGLQIVCNSTLLVTNAVVQFQATVTAGSHIVYNWTISNADNAGLHFSSKSMFTWSYSYAGEYTVSLVARNDLGDEAADVIIRIQEPVENIQVESSIMEDFPFAAVSESTWFRGQADGTNLFYSWSFIGQLANTQYNVTGQNVDYIFNTVDQFTVGLSVFNNVSHDSVRRVINTEVKIADVALTAPLSIPTNSSVNIDAIANKGTHPKYNISFGDGDDEIDVTFPTEHVYTRSTIYSIKVFAYNNVSTVSAETAVAIQDVVADLHIDTNCTQISTANTDISLEADVIQGTDVAFHWEIEHMDLIYVNHVEKDGKLIHYSFPWPGTYNITVDAMNEVSSKKYSCNKTFQGIISSVEIHTDQDERFLYNGYPIVFTVTGTHVEDVVPLWSVTKDGQAQSMPAINADNSLTYIFNNSGVYQVTVVMSNAISNSTVVRPFDIKKLMCNNVSVAIVGTKDRDVLCSRSTEFEVTIDLNGCTDYIVEHHWTVYSMTSCDEPLKNPVVLPDTVFIRSPILNLPTRTLTYGKYCIQLSVSLKSLPVIQEGKFLLAVTPSPLRAIITRGSETLYSSLEPVLLDGRGSYDPDVPRGTESGFTYQWSCHSSASQKSHDQDDDGCFSTMTDSHFWFGSFLEDMEYTVTLTIHAKDRPSGETSQTFYVVHQEVPLVSIECLSCDVMENYLISASQHVTFLGHCADCVAVQYTWSVIRGDGRILPLDHLTTTTMGNKQNLVLISGVLENGYSYSFTLSVSVIIDGKRVSGMSSKMLQANFPPSNGNCSVPTTTVQPLDTLVQVKCEGWIDLDTKTSPLVYDISIQSYNISSNEVDSYMLYHGTSPTQNLYVAPFWPNPLHEPVQLVIYVEDQLGAATMAANRSIAFEELDLSDTSISKHILNNTKHQLVLLARLNNPNSLIQYAITVLMMLNQASQSAAGSQSDEELDIRAEVRDAITMAIAGLPIKSMDDVKLMTFALELLTDFAGEYQTRDCQTLILSEVGKIMDVMKRSVSQGLNQVDFVPHHFLSIAANIINAANFAIYNPQATIENEASPLHETLFVFRPEINGALFNLSFPKTPEQHRQEVVNKALLLIDDILTIVLMTKVQDEMPVNIDLQGIVAHSQRTQADQIWTSSYAEGTGFQIPSDLLISMESSIEDVFQSMLILPSNPYTWGYLGTPITSYVSLLSFKHSNGSDIAIGNLPESQHIQIITQERIQLDEPATGISTCDPTRNIIYFNATIKQSGKIGSPLKISKVTTGSAMHIQVRLEQSTNSSESFNSTGQSVNVFLGKDYQPSSENYEAYLHINMSDMQTETDMRRYSFFIPERSFDVDSEYYLLIENLDIEYSVNVLVGLYFTSCQYYNTTLASWDTAGCVVSEHSIPSCSVCLCNHLTAFGGGILLPLNAIDFSDLTNLDVSRSVVAIVTCTLLFVFYVISAIVCYRLDLSDLRRITVVPLCGKDGSFKYEINVATGRQRRAGTTANVGIKLYGELGKTGSKHLSNPGAFDRNCQDNFQVANDTNLGELCKVLIWHDNMGLSPCWYLKQITIRDLQTDKKYYFPCSEWLSLEMENGFIQKEFYVEAEDRLQTFRNLFTSAASYCMAERHLWFSVFNRPAHNRFTRVQRLTCCVTLLYTFMWVHVMWYGLLKQKSTANQDVVFSFSWEEVVVSIVSNFTMFPISLGLIYLFKKSRSRGPVVSPMPKPASAETIMIDAMCEVSQYGSSFRSFSPDNSIVHSEFVKEKATIVSLPPANHLKRTSTMHPKTKSMKQEIEGKGLADSSSSGVSSEKQSSNSGVGSKKGSSVMRELVAKDLEESSSSGVSSDKTKNSTKSSLDQNDPFWSHTNVYSWSGNQPQSTNGVRKKAGDTTIQRIRIGVQSNSLDDSSDNWEDYLEELDKELNDSSNKSHNLQKTSTVLSRPSMRKPSFGSLGDSFLSDDDNDIWSIEDDTRHHFEHVSSKTDPLDRSRKQYSHNPQWEQAAPPGDRFARKDSLFSDCDSILAASDVPRSERSYSAASSWRMRLEECVGSEQPECLLPFWCVHVAYGLCFILVTMSIIFILLYGNAFGTQMAFKWLLALFFAFCQSFFIFEPVKALIVSLYLASVVKSVEEFEDEDYIDIHPTIDNTETIKDKKFHPVSGFALTNAKREGRQMFRMHLMIRQTLAYVNIFWLAVAIGFLNYGPEPYRLSQTLQNNFVLQENGGVQFQSLQSAGEWWSWTENVLTAEAYSNIPAYIILGPIRLRQIRSLTSSCEAARVSSSLNMDECQGRRGFTEDSRSFGADWNDSAANLTWQYQTAYELQSSEFQGYVDWYSGGGYVQYLGPTYLDSLNTLQSLQDNAWLDLRTRAIFVEFSVYSVSTDLTSVVTLVTEFPVSGGVITTYDIRTQKLLRFMTNVTDATMVCEILLFMVVLYFVVHICCSIQQNGCSYLRSHWNCFEVLTVALCIVNICLYITMVVRATAVFSRYFSDKDIYTSFHQVSRLHTVFRELNSVLIFLLLVKEYVCVCIDVGGMAFVVKLPVTVVHNWPEKIAKQLRFFKSLCVFEKTLSSSFHYLMGCALIFAILVSSYAQFGYLVFGQDQVGFQSFWHAVHSLIAVIQGSFKFEPSVLYSRLLARLYFMSFYVFAYGLILALSLAILSKTYKLVYSRVHSPIASIKEPDYEMKDFMLKQFKKWIGITQPKPAFRSVRFHGLPSISSRNTWSSYSRSTMSNDSNASSDIYGMEFASAGGSWYYSDPLDRLNPTWSEFVNKVNMLETIDQDEESLQKKLAKEVSDWKWKRKIQEMEKERQELLEWKKPPVDPRRRLINQRHSSLTDIKPFSFISRIPVRLNRKSITPPSTSVVAKQQLTGRRPHSDQGARTEFTKNDQHILPTFRTTKTEFKNDQHTLPTLRTTKTEFTKSDQQLPPTFKARGFKDSKQAW